MLLSDKILITDSCCSLPAFGSLSDRSEMAEVITIIVHFLLWCNARHIVDTQMNHNWYNNDYGGRMSLWDINLSQIHLTIWLIFWLADVRRYVFPSPTPPPPQQSERLQMRKIKCKKKNAIPICPPVQPQLTLLMSRCLKIKWLLPAFILFYDIGVESLASCMLNKHSNELMLKGCG